MKSSWRETKPQFLASTGATIESPTFPGVRDLAPRRKTRRTSLPRQLTAVHCTLGTNIESYTFPASDQRLIGRMGWARVKTCSIGALFKYWQWGMAARVGNDLASILHH